MTSPLNHLRRTPLRTLLDSAGADWADLEDCAVASRYVAAADPRRLAIADLSPLPRLGFKGRGTLEAMAKRGIVLEPTPNRAFRQPHGGLYLVLAPGEVFLLAGLTGDGWRLASLHDGWSIEDGERTYPLLRRDSHAWFVVTGLEAPAMFAKICAIDLRPEKFADGAIAQTSVARMSAIVARSDLGGTLAYHVLADSAAALYFCSCLLDAAHEFGGQLVGLETVRSLEAA